MANKKYYLNLSLNLNFIDWTILDEEHNPLSSGKKIIRKNYFFSSLKTKSELASINCSVSAKQIIWHSLKIIKKVTKIQKTSPSKIFLNTIKSKNLPTPTRKERFIELYEKLAKTPETEKLLKELQSKDFHAFHSKKLYLYFTQMGRCAYSGERIQLEKLATETYDIDHIYPRSKIKDDSITQNLALVNKEYNKIKGDNYPINPKWQEKMLPSWDKWKNANLITEEKYNRLIRKTPLSQDELLEITLRKIPTHIQSAKILEPLLCQKYPQTEIIYFEF